MSAPMLLKPGVLDGRTIALAGGPAAVGALGAACAALGARTAVLEADLLDEAAVTQAAGGLGAVDAVVCDAATPFAAAGGGYAALRAALDGAFNALRAVANAALIPAGRGKVVLLGPAAGAGEHAGALRAALENLARTLATEWARHGVTAVTVSPGDSTSAGDVIALVTFLVSPAGDYASGATFTLGAAA